MDYKKIYTANYFKGNDYFFYTLGYGRFQNAYFNNLYRSIKKYVDQIKDGKVLDIGCAYGYMLKKFPKSYKKYGIDISEHAISQANKVLPNSTFKVAGAEEALPFSENYFDIIICNDVIEHVESPEKLVDNVKKSLKKGGIFYVNTPNLNLLRKKLFFYADKKEHHISLFTHTKLKNLLKKSGFEILEQYTYSSITYFFFLKFKANIGHEQAFICKKI